MGKLTLFRAALYALDAGVSKKFLTPRPGFTRRPFESKLSSI